MGFDYFLPVNLKFGRGRFGELGALASGLGRRALIVTGRSSARASGLLGRAEALLAACGVEPAAFDRVPANPLISTVYAGVQTARERGCDLVIGLGGGSAMDAAKGIAFAALNPGDLSDYIFARKTGLKALPVVAVPTTAGTGSEGNGFAILTHDETRDKKALRSAAIVPAVSIVDSELIETMPAPVVAATGFDAFVHCAEAFIGRRANPISDSLALEGIRLIAASVEKAYHGAASPADWDNLALAAACGGMAIGVAGSGLGHALEHPVSGLYDATHGQGLAALFPAVLARSWRGAVSKFARIAAALGADAAQPEPDLAWQAVERTRALVVALNLSQTLTGLGASACDIDWLAGNAQKIMQASIDNNPLAFDRSGLVGLYRECL